jgi:replicative DNA helicase
MCPFNQEQEMDDLNDANRRDGQGATDEDDPEAGLIGTFLMHPELILAHQHQVEPADFANVRNAAAYKALVDLIQREPNPNHVAIKKQLAGQPIFSDGTAGAYIADTVSAARAPDQVSCYADAVVAAAASRRSELGELGWKLHRWSTGMLTKQEPRLIRVAGPGNALEQFETGPGRVCLVGAPPAFGKTALLNQLAFDALRLQPELRVLFANVEMSQEALWERELARLSGVPHNLLRFRSFTEKAIGRITPAIMELNRIMKRATFMEGPFTVAGLEKRAKETAADLIVVDYVQRFAPAKTSGDATQAMEIMGCCREIAARGGAVLAAAAINRMSYKDGDVSAFRDSSELEYASDNAYLIVRRGSGSASAVTLKAVKNRFGECCDIKLKFDGPRLQFIKA